MKDYMDTMKDVQTNMAEQFMNADRGNFTKEMIQRLRLRRGLTNPIESQGDEYGNYKKFEDGRNKVEQVNDPGYDDVGLEKFHSNVQKMFETMDHPDKDGYQKTKQENEDHHVENSVKSEMVADQNIMETYVHGKVTEEDDLLLKQF